MFVLCAEKEILFAIEEKGKFTSHALTGRRTRIVQFLLLFLLQPWWRTIKSKRTIVDTETRERNEHQRYKEKLQTCCFWLSVNWVRFSSVGASLFPFFSFFLLVYIHCVDMNNFKSQRCVNIGSFWIDERFYCFSICNCFNVSLYWWTNDLPTIL